RAVRRGRQAGGARRPAHDAGRTQRPARPRRVPHPLGERNRTRDRVQRLPDHRVRGGVLGGDDPVLADQAQRKRRASTVRIRVWGPASPEASLEDRIARYISAPLSPVEVRELPCSVSFRDTPPSEWRIGSATIVCEAVNHRGPTLGFRITEGDTTVCYIPDHEPAL